MLEQLRLIADALPWTFPAIAGGGVLAGLTMTMFPSHRSHSDRLGFALFVWCVVVALVVTLSPVKNSYFGVPTTGCNLSVWKPLNYHYWTASGSRPPNVWLLFPAGVGAMLVDGFWRRFLTIGFLFALPPGIEALQDYYPELKRSCSSQDIVDNWTGLVLGLALGLVLMIVIGLVRLVLRRPRRRRREALEYSSATPAGASVAEPEELPLGGGNAGGYSDFADFDDTPSSTRWWSEGEEGASPAPDRGEPLDRTQVMPVHRRGEDESDSDATQIIRRS